MGCDPQDAPELRRPSCQRSCSSSCRGSTRCRLEAKGPYQRHGSECRADELRNSVLHTGAKQPFICAGRPHSTPTSCRARWSVSDWRSAAPTVPSAYSRPSSEARRGRRLSEPGCRHRAPACGRSSGPGAECSGGTPDGLTVAPARLIGLTLTERIAGSFFALLQTRPR